MEKSHFLFRKVHLSHMLRATISISLCLIILVSGIPPSALYGVAAASEITQARSNPGMHINVDGPSNVHVNTFTGNLFYSIPLFTIPGRGLPVEISMSYNSIDHFFVPNSHGYGWKFSYDMYYSEDASGNITIDGVMVTMMNSPKKMVLLYLHPGYMRLWKNINYINID